MCLISEEWTSAEGADISDLEEVLNNSFTVFDTIDYSISGLRVESLEDGTFKVNYVSKIVGDIRGQGIKYKDSSDVTEIVGYEGGKLRILRTTSGQFWRK